MLHTNISPTNHDAKWGAVPVQNSQVVEMDEGQSDLCAVERCCRCGEGLLQFLRQTSTRNILHHDVQGDLYDMSKEVSVLPLRNVAHLAVLDKR